MGDERPLIEPLQLRVTDLAQSCRVLGPGTRFIVWVQGCTLNCPGCVSPHTHSFSAGRSIAVPQLADEIEAASHIDGLTISGGEPMQQADALVSLLEILRERRPELTVMCYTGYTLAEIEHQGTDAQKRLLMLIDCLIDGRFEESLQTDPPPRWRGSTNQQVHLRTERVKCWQPLFEEVGVWLELQAEHDGGNFRGIPPPGFAEAFRLAVLQQGVKLEPWRRKNNALEPRQGSQS